MRRRAAQVEETRERITRAAVKLHTTVGPAGTSIAKVAEEAGVTRLTVYRHFRNVDALFEACMGHWAATHPLPDPSAWSAIEPLPERAGRAFGDLYRWYGRHNEELYPIYRDWSAMPASAREAAEAQFSALADALLMGASPGPGIEIEEPVRIGRAVTHHLVGFWTWWSLVRECGLRVEEAIEVAVRTVLAVADAPAGISPGGREATSRVGATKGRRRSEAARASQTRSAP